MRVELMDERLIDHVRKLTDQKCQATRKEQDDKGENTTERRPSQCTEKLEVIVGDHLHVKKVP
jgi:hypothetical protein